jgi:hypothetical protein
VFNDFHFLIRTENPRVGHFDSALAIFIKQLRPLISSVPNRESSCHGVERSGSNATSLRSPVAGVHRAP